MIIALDGPAGSGKSTIAREVAKRLGMRYLDTGAMYRTITLLALEAGLVPDRISAAAELAADTTIRMQERPNDLTRVFVGEREVTDDIRGRLVSQNVSAVSADPGVRAVLTKKQREEAAKGDVLLEGRDMGTVVVPDADVKVFLTASIEERAQRRRLQLEPQGMSQPLPELIADIAARDAYDSGRAVAPLCKADDAVEIDTTGMTIAEVISAVCALVARTEKDREVGRWPFSRLYRGPLDRLLYRILYCFLAPMVRLFFRVRITGSENIPAGGAVVVACNHRSNLDPFFLGCSFPRTIHFMAKAELWSFKPLGWLVEKLGVFPVHRGEVDREAVQRALEVLNAGAVMGLFPEGRRYREGALGDIRSGVSMFSLREGVVTIPVVIRGTDRVVRNGIPRFPRVDVTFGPPLMVPSKELSRRERAAVTTERLVDAFHSLFSASPEGT